MGGVVRNIGGAFKKVSKEGKRTYRKVEKATKVLVINPIHTVNKLGLGLGKVIIQGKSFKRTFANSLADITKNIRDIYSLVGNKWLGINDDRFLGIKDKNLSKLGKITKDFLYDDAAQTIGFVVIAVVAVVAAIISIFTLGWGTSIAGALLAVVTSVVMALAIGAIAEGLAQFIYDDYMKGVNSEIKAKEEKLRVSYLSDILNGSIFDKMAGGYLYASQFAGNIYYDATTPGNCNISVGGEFNLSPHCMRTNIGYVDSTLKNLAGDKNFSVVSMSLDTN